MNTKSIEYGGQEWVWPAYDEKLLQVNDWAKDIDAIIPFVTDFMVCVQAGGACGIWPYILCQYFNEVYTFEPDPVNFHCLTENLSGLGNVYYENAALGAKSGTCNIQRDQFEQNNCGAGYMVSGGETPVVTIDSYNLGACGLIQLDVEGFEVEALLGAERTIKEHRPIIVIEEKMLPHARGKELKARNYLKSIGYKEVGRIHRDVVFSC